MSVEEVSGALRSLREDKALGPDSFPPLFFHRYWSIVREEVVEAIQLVFEGRDISMEWKKTLITLIPKWPDASLLSHFRPISLCTIFYKVCVRIFVNRLKPIMPRLISLEQDIFIGGQSITDNILLAQEFMHDLQRTSDYRSLMVIKLDMEQTYDRMCWSFLRRSFRS